MLFHPQQGIIRHKGRIWIGMNIGMQQDIVHALHCSPIGGHSGFHSTYHRVKHVLMDWPQKSRATVCGAMHCVLASKGGKDAIPEITGPTKNSCGGLASCNSGLITGLPKSSGFDCILVVVDKFSRNAHFLPLKHSFTAFSVALLYVKEIYHLHGLPLAIVWIGIQYLPALYGRSFSN